MWNWLKSLFGGKKEEDSQNPEQETVETPEMPTEEANLNGESDVVEEKKEEAPKEPEATEASGEEQDQ